VQKDLSAIISSKHRRRRCLHNSATWAPVVADIFVVHGVVVEVVVVDVGVTAAADDAHVAPPTLSLPTPPNPATRCMLLLIRSPLPLLMLSLPTPPNPATRCMQLFTSRLFRFTKP